MAKRITLAQMFSAEARYTFKLTTDAGRPSVTLKGKPAGTELYHLADALEDADVSVKLKLSDVGDVTDRTISEKDVKGAVFADYVMAESKAEGEQRPTARKTTDKPDAGANRLNGVNV